MDALTYNYYSNSNKLNFVADPTPATNYTADIDNQASGNYVYDNSGQLKSDASEGINMIIWNVYGKIDTIQKTSGTIAYFYDGAGNRIGKTAGGKATLYVRDGSGNVMAVYEAAAGSGAHQQVETHLYGSSRLGMIAAAPVIGDSLALASGYGKAYRSGFVRGQKDFELSNHLGNVLATVTDRKVAVASTTNTSLVGYYEPDVAGAQDYYPFGMLIPSRKYTATGAYRYGFNGKENDNEVKGEGSQQDYGMRIFDPRLGRFLSIDPLHNKYPELTPYQFASNRPIDGIDLDGLEYATFNIFVDKNQKVSKITYTTDYELKNTGTEGAGVKYIIYKVAEGNRPDEVRWSKNLYGIYQGGNNPKLPKEGENYRQLYYDYRLKPIDETDANAKQHDLDYDNIPPAGIEGFLGVLDDRSSKANEDYIERARKTITKFKKGESDYITGKPVTKEAAKAANFGMRGFYAAEKVKKLKSNKSKIQP